MSDILETPEDEINHVLAVQPSPAGLYLLLTTYPQSDAMNPDGQIYLTGEERGGSTDLLLSVADPLSSLWTSPAGYAWAGSSAGTVWTNAPVRFPSPPAEPIPTEFGERRQAWSATTLPNLHGHTFPPDITSLYGFSDSDVYAGAANGSIYHWDGASWVEQLSGDESAINELHGTSSNDVWAAGHDALCLHFDGQRWNRVPVPAEIEEYAVLSGVRAIQPGLVYVCETGGAILAGGATGLAIAGRSENQWFGVAHFQSRIILASAPGGSSEFRDGQLQTLKSSFDATDVYEAGRSLFFIEEEQKPRPCVIEYRPSANPQWGRRSY
jgi:hypothetical protein